MERRVFTGEGLVSIGWKKENGGIQILPHPAEQSQNRVPEYRRVFDEIEQRGEVVYIPGQDAPAELPLSLYRVSNIKLPHAP